VHDRGRQPLRSAGLTAGPAVAIVVLQMVVFPMPLGAVLSGAVLGLLGALAAVGLALVWRANRVVNFAQGDLGAFPATLTVMLLTAAGFPWLVGMALGLGAAILTGLLADVLVIRRFFHAPRLLLTVATIGLGQVLAFAALLLPQAWGEVPAVRTLAPPFAWTADIGGVVFDSNDLLAVIVAPLLLAAVAVVLLRTDVGVAVRAAAERGERAAMLGIPVRVLEAGVWVVATVLSFAAVVLTAGVASLPLGAALGLTVLLRALAAVVIGRMTHLPAIALTAVAIGVLESGVRWNTGEEYLVAPILAALIIGSLLLQGRRSTRNDDGEGAWGATASVRPVPRELAGLPEVRAARWVVLVIVCVIGLGLPHLLGTNGQLKAGVVLVFATIGVSVVVLTGWAGQVSLAQMTFVGAGGALAAVGMSEWGWDPFVAALAAGPLGAVVAVLVGLPALRLRGLYLAVTTLAIALAASAWLFSNRVGDWIPEGSFRRPDLLHRWSIDTPLRLYYLALAVLVISLVAMRGIRRSRTGRVLVALRDNPDGVAAYGVSPTRARLTAFALSGWVAAVAGVVLVVHQGAFRPVTYVPEQSVAVFVATVIGGIGSLAGAVIGAVFQRGSLWLLPSPWSFLATGAGVLLVLLSAPDGIGGLGWRGRDRFLRWVARRHGIAVAALDRTHDEDPTVTDTVPGRAGTEEPQPVAAGVDA
jgi:branched-chain amino acid transport system permease protein